MILPDGAGEAMHDASGKRIPLEAAIRMLRERLHWVTIADEGKDDYVEDMVIQQGPRMSYRHKLQIPPRAQLPLPCRFRCATPLRWKSTSTRRRARSTSRCSARATGRSATRRNRQRGGKTFVSIPGYLPARARSLTRYKKDVECSATLSQEAITDLAQKAKDAKTTRIVSVSASENEESMESPKSNGGLFTQTYIAALGKAHACADAFDQAKPTVIRSARTVGHSQTPRLLAVPESAQTRMQY